MSTSQDAAQLPVAINALQMFNGVKVMLFTNCVMPIIIAALYLNNAHRNHRTPT